MEGGGGERPPRDSCAGILRSVPARPVSNQPGQRAPGAGWPSLHYTMKSLFKRLFPPKDTEETGERLERLEIEMRRLQEEWTDVYAKFRVMQMRVAKQAQRLDESSQEEPPREESVVGQTSLATLSPRLAKIQQQILARRSRGEPPKEGE